ncbi:tRNA1(Val) (adenine(37)-N6)-methyltransferase [Hutsoniella sourekii]|uniref:tRNA1(Val) (adenine(37)-N6)-methyltransferase n=1 Tax=Hutsoniella sourekii TaxID=87650 RepID=UPI0004842775|nr:tRNA1(Val) (adenine(37)-N6)-methyltransferase [Hutsoniella sourekii]
MQSDSVNLKQDERIDNFLQANIQIIQNPQYFMLSVDALLLADFIELPKRSFHYVDFCCGNGVIPLLLSARTDQNLLGIELQEDLVDMARRSAQLNKVDGQVTFLCQDLKEFKRPSGVLFDVVSCNPPYFVVEGSQAVHQLDSHAIARHEIYLKLEDWVDKARQIMKTKGKLYIVHRPERLDDLMEVLLAKGFAVNRLKFVYSKPSGRAKTVLIEAIYQGGRQGVKVDPPFIVHQEDGSYSPEMLAIYHG